MSSIHITDEVLARVGDVLADIAREEILTRWRNLSDGQIREKNPGDLVTEADEAAEAQLTQALQEMFPGSIAFGEEAVAKDPSRLEALDGDAPVWVMDPVDGTAAFAAGSPRFTTILTLIENQKPIAAWVQAPAKGTRAHAAIGRGTWVDGGLVSMDSTSSLWDATVLIGPMGYIPGMGRAAHKALSLRVARPITSIGIGADYLDLLTGDADITVFGTRNPWEMPAGALLVSEAGGVIIDGRGNPVDPFAPGDRPFIAASTRAQADAVLAAVAKAPVEAV